jgi:hypothetical protein
LVPEFPQLVCHLDVFAFFIAQMEQMNEERASVFRFVRCAGIYV